MGLLHVYSVLCVEVLCVIQDIYKTDLQKMEICIEHICCCTIFYVYSSMFLILKKMYSCSFTVYMHMFIPLNKIFLFVL